MKAEKKTENRDFCDLSSTAEEILLENEKRSNKLMAISLISIQVLVLITVLIVYFNQKDFLAGTLWFLIFLLLVNCAISIVTLKSKYRPGTKHILLGTIMTSLFIMTFGLGNGLDLFVALPVMVASVYSDRKLTLRVALINLFCALSGGVLSILTRWYFDLNYIVVPDTFSAILNPGFSRYDIAANSDILGTLKNEVIYHLPVFLATYGIVSAFFCFVSKRSYENLLRQAAIMERKVRPTEELAMAKDVQKSLIPLDFKPLEERFPQINLYGIMMGIESVGGDIFDAFPMDDTHIALMVGDVSGRGAEAVLFMDRAKRLINECALTGASAGDVLSSVNNQLVDKNADNLYITAWLGILNTVTGDVSFASAGQNAQYVSVNGRFEKIEYRANNILLGAIRNVQYRTETFSLDHGDRLFLYTDGTITAMNKNKEMYGESRLLSVLDANVNLPMQELVENVQADIKEFLTDGTQNDDVTMLAVAFK